MHHPQHIDPREHATLEALAPSLTTAQLVSVACERCGRYFMTERPDITLPGLTGTCACGGRFAAVD